MREELKSIRSRILQVCLMVMFVAQIVVGCTMLSSSTTTENDDGSTTTVTESSLLLDLSEEDVGALSSLVNVASSVWDLVSEVLVAMKSTDGTFTDGAGVALTREDVIEKSNSISILCYRECSSFPTADEVYKYVAEGTMPSEAALIRFAETGKLHE